MGNTGLGMEGKKMSSTEDDAACLCFLCYKGTVRKRVFLDKINKEEEEESGEERKGD